MLSVNRTVGQLLSEEESLQRLGLTEIKVAL